MYKIYMPLLANFFLIKRKNCHTFVTWFSFFLFRQVFPLHELPALEKLQRSWVRAFLSPQPLDDICKYFGVKITMYFAWLGHYTTALIVPAAVGAIYWVCMRLKYIDMIRIRINKNVHGTQSVCVKRI